MKKFLFTLNLLITNALIILAQNAKVNSIVIDSETKQPVANLPVWFNTNKTYTNDRGEVQFTLPYGKYIIVISTNEYEMYTKQIEINSDKFVVDTIKLVRRNFNIDEINLSENYLSDDIDDKQAQNISGLLQAFTDPFVNLASYNLATFNFKIKGYDASSFNVYINGLPMNDFETGRANYSDWGGLNNVTRNKMFQNGIDATTYAMGNIGGSTNILMSAGDIRKQNVLSYALSNRNYTHRLMYTYATGFNEKNIAYAFSLSKRYAERGYVKGTWYDSYSYYASVEKKSDKNSISLILIGAPYKRGMQAPATQEAYDLIGSNYYNPNWGYQNGIVRNAKVRNVHQPIVIFTDKYKINNKTFLNASLGYQFGRYGTTALNWYNANDPRPDYYRYLPSYQTTTYLQNITADYWTSSPYIFQINWDKLYQINYLSNLEGKSAKYILEEQRKDNKQLTYNFNLSKESNKGFTIYAGLNGVYGKTHYFKVLNDLLGANYWLDVDQYAERDFPNNTTILINDLNNPYRQVKVGDVFGYDYDINYFNTNLWTLLKKETYRIDYYFQLQGSYSSFYRMGYMKNGRFPEQSEGKSPVSSFLHYAAKAGMTYKITGRHFILLNLANINQPPLAENVYINPRTSYRLIPNIHKEDIYSSEISYIYRGLKATGRLTAYYTYFKNQTDIRSFYHDQYNTFVNLVLQGIDKIHQGIELGTEIKINSTLSFVGAYNFGNYVYVSRPIATISYDNGSKPDTTEKIYMKYFYVPGPQFAGSIGLKYRHPKFWFASINLNQFDKFYLDFNPQRRTEQAVSNLGPGDPLIQEIIRQQKLKGAYTIDVSLGKSWKIGKNNININLNVNNLLNNKNIIVGGYEQMRFDYETKNVNKFPPKYFYAYGRTYFVMISFRF